MKNNHRKLEHLRICIEKDVETNKAGFENVKLIHKILPEIDYDKIDTKITFLGKKLDYPVIIEGMTGGVPAAKKINRDLAEIADEFNIGMGVGSQRAAIENTTLAKTYYVRDAAPDILLISNLGAVQLNYECGIKECKKAYEMIEADALALHLNPLQECVQEEGNRNFSRLIEKINSVSTDLKKDKIPVIAKGISTGISPEIAKKLNVSAIDTGGMGGTSWALVESYRKFGNPRIGKLFSDWGISTSECVANLSGIKTPIIASGGIRTGIDAAKSIALGAKCTGMALPFLKAGASGGKKGIRKFLNDFIREFKIAMFLTGSGKVSELKGKVVR